VGASESDAAKLRVTNTDTLGLLVLLNYRRSIRIRLLNWKTVMAKVVTPDGGLTDALSARRFRFDL
jgi:hypothetical protein